MKQHEPATSEPTLHPERRNPRRPYRTPHLIEYGSISKLTQGTRTTGQDGPGGGFKKTSCL